MPERPHPAIKMGALSIMAISNRRFHSIRLGMACVNDFEATFYETIAYRILPDAKKSVIHLILLYIVALSRAIYRI